MSSRRRQFLLINPENGDMFARGRVSGAPIPSFAYDGILSAPNPLRFAPSSGIMINGEFFRSPAMMLLASMDCGFDFSGTTNLSMRNIGWVDGNVSFDGGCIGSIPMTDLLLRDLVGATYDLIVYCCQNMVSCSAPLLRYIGDELRFDTCGSITSIVMPRLVYVNSTSTFRWLPVLTEINLPAMDYAGGTILFTNCAALERIDLSALRYCGSSIQGTGNLDSLTELVLSDSLKLLNGDFVFDRCAFPSATVDALLIRLAGLDGANGTSAYTSHTVTITGNSEPAGDAGLDAKSVLEGRSCIVTLNTP